MNEWDEVYANGSEFAQPSQLLLDLTIKSLGEAGQKPKSVLDIGCGTGNLAKRLTHLGLNVTGIDLSEVAIAKAQKLVPSGQFEMADFIDWHPNNQFDLIVCNLVYAFVSPTKRNTFFQKASKLVGDGAGLLLVTPAYFEDSNFLPKRGTKQTHISTPYFDTLIRARDQFAKAFAVDISYYGVDFDPCVRLTMFATNNKQVLPFDSSWYIHKDMQHVAARSFDSDAGPHEQAHFVYLLDLLTDEGIVWLGEHSGISFSNNTEPTANDWLGILDEMDREKFYELYPATLKRYGKV